jgi:hypothetical protein
MVSTMYGWYGRDVSSQLAQALAELIDAEPLDVRVLFRLDLREPLWGG